MKVQITNESSERDEYLKGWRKVLTTPKKIKFYQVVLHINFSEEERAILTEYDLWKAVVLYDDVTYDADHIKAHPILATLTDPLPFTIADFANEKGFHKHFSTPVEASQWVQKLKSEILPKIKNYITASQQTGTGSDDTFEL